MAAIVVARLRVQHGGNRTPPHWVTGHWFVDRSLLPIYKQEFIRAAHQPATLMGDIGRILSHVRERPGRKARQIAADLDLPRREVNSVLYRELGRNLRRDSSYRWWPVEAQTRKPKPTIQPAKTEPHSTVAAPQIVVAPPPSSNPNPAKSAPKQSHAGKIWLAIIAAVIGLFWYSNSSVSSQPSHGYSSNSYVGLPARTHGGVPVRGYVRKNGTYVAPHYRTAADGLRGNNWSTKGNTNPYTGKPGTRYP